MASSFTSKMNVNGSPLRFEVRLFRVSDFDEIERLYRAHKRDVFEARVRHFFLGSLIEWPVRFD